MLENKKKHVLQWHILHRCNLRCSHCYQEEYKFEPSYELLERIFYQYREFCKKYNFRGHINFTGGEPFISENLFPLISLCEKYHVTYGILTNGTLINDETAEKLGKLEFLSFVQVSIDGKKETHDKIRGQGNFEKAFKGLKKLRKSGIQTMAAFTCHKSNKNELKEVIRIVRKNRIDRFWCDRLIPMGSNKENVLSTEEYRDIVKLLTAGHYRKSFFGSTQVHLNRSLQFLEGGDCYYKCSAGISLLTVLADGTLLPCRRLPIPIGNCFDNDIISLYESSQLIKELKREEIPKDCMACPKAELCRGGAKCLNYAMTGEYNRKDVNCWLIY